MCGFGVHTRHEAASGDTDAEGSGVAAPLSRRGLVMSSGVFFEHSSIVKGLLPFVNQKL
jgi:hypothetical protein